MPADPIVSIWGIDYAKAFEALTIQPHLQEQLVAWLEHGTPPSKFLQDVICNNLMAIFVSPDRTQQASVRGVVRFFVEYAPENSASFLHDANALFNWPRRLNAKRWKEKA